MIDRTVSNLFTVTNGLISFPPPSERSGERRGRGELPLRAFDVPRHSPPPAAVFAMNHNAVHAAAGGANVRKTYGNGVRRAVSTMALSSREINSFLITLKYREPLKNASQVV